jgi:hypothetical protein
LEQWSLAELFHFYTQKLGTPIGSIERLDISIAFGNYQRFVVKRNREERSWQTVKDIIASLFGREQKRMPNKRTFDVLIE